jgi:hypothetical protein
VRSEALAEVGHGFSRSGGADRGGQLGSGGGGCGGGFEVVVCEGGSGEGGVGEGSSAGSVLAGGFVGWALGEGGALGLAVEVSEGVGVRALGHASAATTLNLYAHMWPGDDDRIRQAVDRAFGSDAEDRLRTEGQAQ